MLRVVLLITALCMGCVMSYGADDRLVILRPENPPKFSHGIVGVDTRRPLVIAHRGSSGIYPEHTREGYLHAIEKDGANVIECDVSVSRDGKFICRHNPFLSESTDIADHPEFADRKRTIINFEYYGTLRNYTDWFLPDFTLAELRTLRAIQTNTQRDQGYNGKLQIATFDEYVEIAQSSRRTIAIYPELKYPRWINGLNLFNNNKSFEEVFVETLKNYGYSESIDPCLLQSFEMESLRVLNNLTNLQIAMGIEYDYQATPELIEQYAEFADGVVTWKCSFVDHYGPTGAYKNWIRNVSDMVDRIHAAGMKVHVYTFRNEASDLPWDVEQDPLREYDLYMKIGVDGFFTDFPGTLSRYLDDLYREEPEKPDCPEVNRAPVHGGSLIVLLLIVLSGFFLPKILPFCPISWPWFKFQVY